MQLVSIDLRWVRELIVYRSMFTRAYEPPKAAQVHTSAVTIKPVAVAYLKLVYIL